MSFRKPGFALLLAVGTASIATAQSLSTWGGYGADAQHTGISTAHAKRMTKIVWQVPIDKDPQYSGGALFTHYGSPSITNSGAVLVAVKTGATDGYEFQARRSYDGGFIWRQETGYSLPGHSWTPTVSGALVDAKNTYAMPAIGGGVTFRTYADTAIGTSRTFHFYGEDAYGASDEAKAAYDAAVKICTPLTADLRGNVYFGYRVEGTVPNGLTSGYARVSPKGKVAFVRASSLVPTDSDAGLAAMSCGPAINPLGTRMYVSVRRRSSETGYLVAVDPRTMTLINSVELRDALNNGSAIISDVSTASPTIGPDGRVFYGVLSNNYWATHARGFLLQFRANLEPVTFLDGEVRKPLVSAFGWDDSASVVPRRSVPGYLGSSPYLLLTKYNNYAGVGGDGVNRLALVDPGAVAIDPVTGEKRMAVVQSVIGPTPDEEYIDSHPFAVREWCINSAAIDPKGGSLVTPGERAPGQTRVPEPVRAGCAIVNCEDGWVYKWDFGTGTLTEAVQLTEGVGEAYTPTMIGKDGTVYAINNAILFAVRS